MILDLVLGGIFALALIIGAILGFAKQMNTFFGVVVGILCAILLSRLTVAILMLFPAVKQLYLIPAEWFTDATLNTVVALDLDKAEGIKTVNDLLSSGAFSLFGGTAESIYATMVANNINTVAGYFGLTLLKAFFGLISWIIFYIIVYFSIKAIAKQLNILCEIEIVSVINRIIGALWLFAIVYTVLIGVLLTFTEIVIATLIPEVTQGFYEFLQQSVIASFLHSTNLFAPIFCPIFDVALPVLPLV